VRFNFCFLIIAKCFRALIIVQYTLSNQWSLWNEHDRKVKISAVPTKTKSWEPAYSQALNQKKIDRQEEKIQRVRQADSQTAMVDGVWS